LKEKWERGEDRRETNGRSLEKGTEGREKEGKMRMGHAPTYIYRGRKGERERDTPIFEDGNAAARRRCSE
jgi:hypothetical protein